MAETQVQEAPQAINYPRLEEAASSYLGVPELAKIERAYRFACECHKDQRRRSGEPYINHPVEVARILSEELHMDEDVICAALLHDTVEDTDTSLDDLTDLFGPVVAELVDGVTKLTSINAKTIDAKQALNLRKMFLAMSKDIRVVIIKIADRLHNMRTMAALPPHKRILKSQETMYVYAPLADRLGLGSIKWELEDLAFFYLEPDEYERIARMVAESREQREETIDDAVASLTEELHREGIDDFTLSGRPKHLWSIYQKMTKKGKEFSDIYDLIALRVITSSVGDCYTALGAVHTLWHPVPGRFKDYIAMPKPNLYQSLHTTVIGPKGRPIEIQIRTKEMHEQAEYGIAAHWLYKKAGNSEGTMGKDDRSIDEQINWIRRSLDWTMEGELEDPTAFMDSLRVDLYEREIFVFTPKGEVVSLRRGSTPLDFAYAVHTEVGNHCVGAKVNGAVVTLNSELSMGDRVEILTNRNAKPSRDWLDIVKTPSARSKIRRFFTASTKSDDAERGRTELARELRKRGYGISTARCQKAIVRVCEENDYKTPDDLFAAIETGKLQVKSAANYIQAVLEENSPEAVAALAEREAHLREQLAAMAEDRTMVTTPPPRPLTREQRKHRNNCGVVVKGDPDLLVHLAHCCTPVAGDDIVGFITRGRGVSVHRATCPNVKGLMTHPERMIPVEWDGSGTSEFRVEIVIDGHDRLGLLADITTCLSKAGVNILSTGVSTAKSGAARLRFLISISDTAVLANVFNQLKHIPSVDDARRIVPGEGANQMKRRVHR